MHLTQSSVQCVTAVTIINFIIINIIIISFSIIFITIVVTVRIVIYCCNQF